VRGAEPSLQIRKNSCKGQNACKGQGFLNRTKADCDAAKAKKKEKPGT
jgi:hypothetical protein